MRFSALRWIRAALLLTGSISVSAQPGREAADTVPSAALSKDELTAAPVPSDTTLTADLDNATTIWDKACAACHGEMGQGVQEGVPDIRNSALSLRQIMQVVSAGRKTMPAFAVFTEQQLLDISTYVSEQL